VKAAVLRNKRVYDEKDLWDRWVLNQARKSEMVTDGDNGRLLDISRTGQLVDAIGNFACLVFLFGGICETASCPVRDLSSPRVD